MPPPPKRTRVNTLCIVSFLIVLLGLGMYSIFKPPTPQENIQTLSESQIRTPLEDFMPPTAAAANNIRVDRPALPDDNIELIET